jgi:4'-phosphopantetheinyl transferase
MIFTALMIEHGTAADDTLSRWSLPADDFPGARRRSLLGRAILRRLLFHATGFSAAGWKFGAEPSGRPIALNRNCELIPAVSLSHSGGWVACAVSYVGPVGIDIEVHCLSRNFSEIAAAAFGPAETRRVAAHGASGFYRIWTLKEAMAKASGAGIAEVADRTDRVAEGPRDGVWRANVGSTPWWLAHRTPVSGLSIAVAIRDEVARQHTPQGAP